MDSELSVRVGLKGVELALYRGSNAGAEGGDQIAVTEAIIYTSYIDPELSLTEVFQRISGLLTRIAVAPRVGDDFVLWVWSILQYVVLSISLTVLDLLHFCPDTQHDSEEAV